MNPPFRPSATSKMSFNMPPSTTTQILPLMSPQQHLPGCPRIHFLSLHPLPHLQGWALSNLFLDHLPSSQLTELSQTQGCMTSLKHLLCQHDWISWKILFPRNEYCHSQAHSQNHQQSKHHPRHSSNHTNATTWHPVNDDARTTNKVPHRHSESLRRPS